VFCAKRRFLSPITPPANWLVSPIVIFVEFAVSVLACPTGLFDAEASVANMQTA